VRADESGAACKQNFSRRIYQEFLRHRGPQIRLSTILARGKIREATLAVSRYKLAWENVARKVR
jgi:hypothetical protein